MKSLIYINSIIAYAGILLLVIGMGLLTPPSAGVDLNYGGSDGGWRMNGNPEEHVHIVPRFMFRCCFGCGIVSYARDFFLWEPEEQMALQFNAAGSRYGIQVNGHEIFKMTDNGNLTTIIPIADGILRSGLNRIQLNDISFQDNDGTPVILKIGPEAMMRNRYRFELTREGLFLLAFVFLFLSSIVAGIRHRSSTLIILSVSFIIAFASFFIGSQISRELIPHTNWSSTDFWISTAGNIVLLIFWIQVLRIKNENPLRRPVLILLAPVLIMTLTHFLVRPQQFGLPDLQIPGTIIALLCGLYLMVEVRPGLKETNS